MRKATQWCALARAHCDPAESKTSGMHRNSMRENRETPQPPAAPNVAGRREKAMSNKSLMHGGGESYSGEKRETAGGGCGGKAAGQGERGTAQPVPDTESGKRAKRAGTRAGSSQERWETTVHCTAAPCERRTAPGQLHQPKETGCTGSGRGDMGRIWTRAGGATYRSSWPSPSRGLSSAAIQASLYPENRWAATTIGDRGVGG